MVRSDHGFQNGKHGFERDVFGHFGGDFGFAFLQIPRAVEIGIEFRVEIIGEQIRDGGVLFIGFHHRAFGGDGRLANVGREGVQYKVFTQSCHFRSFR